MKKLIFYSFVLLFICFQYSCEIELPSDDDDDGEGNNTQVIMSNPYPYNGAMEIPLTPTLMWDLQTSNINNLRFEIFMDTVDNPAVFLGQVTGQSYYVSVPLKANSTYYWKLHAVFNEGDCYSEIWRFTTTSSGGLPPEPVNPTPVNGAIEVALTPQLSWECNGSGLTFDVYLDVNNPPAVIAASSISNLNYTISTPLQENQTYYWRIVAKNYYGETAGNVWKFTTITGLPTEGLVAYYPFSGNTNDESGYGNNGLNYGAMLTFDRFNSMGKAYSFNGSSSYIQVPNSYYLHPAYAITISAWVRLNDIYSSSTILAKGSETSTGMYSIKYNSSTRTTDFQIKFSNNMQGLVRSGTDLSANLWYNIAGIYDGNTLMIYVNGILENSNTPGGSLGSNSSSLNIGSSSEGDFMHGDLDDIRIYNRALTGNEVLQLFHEGGWRK